MKLLTLVVWLLLISISAHMFIGHRLPSIIVCSHSFEFKTHQTYFFKVPNFNDDCEENATHWRLYGERLSN